jgi:N-methylhydantoinase A/oxoprolinase/acetone carboxylase beta subunit
LDPFVEGAAHQGILAWHKAPTTPDPSDGIETCIRSLLISANVEPERIASVNIGTTVRFYSFTANVRPGLISHRLSTLSTLS